MPHGVNDARSVSDQKRLSLLKRICYGIEEHRRALKDESFTLEYAVSLPDNCLLGIPNVGERCIAEFRNHFCQPSRKAM